MVLHSIHAEISGASQVGLFNNQLLWSDLKGNRNLRFLFIGRHGRDG
ncbi:hypothetical protein [Synechococcus sp. MIT S1220]